MKALRSRKDVRGRIEAFFDGGQGWILVAIVGFLTACVAYIVDVTESPIFDWKEGYCLEGFSISEKVSIRSPVFITFLPVRTASSTRLRSIQNLGVQRASNGAGGHAALDQINTVI